MSSSKPAVAIIGAGVAGLAAAIRMACAGRDVTVIEGAPEPGGKLRERHQGAYRFDLGPSLFTWPELILELDELTRSSIPNSPSCPERFEFTKLDRSTHYFWEDGTQLIAWSQPEQFASECEKSFGVNPILVKSHLEHSSASFEATRRIFLEQSLHDWNHDIPGQWGAVVKFFHRLPWIGTLHRWNQKRLKHPKLAQLFDRYATYNGSDPHRAPAMLHVIPHLEHGQGTFFPNDGMIGITRHLYGLAEALGVKFMFNREAIEILHKGGEVQGVKVSDNQQQQFIIEANCVISNADVWPTYRRLLPNLKAPERILQQERSTSGVIFYWGIEGNHPTLHLHNILFSQDYQAEFESIRNEGHPGDDPTVYINISSKVKPSDAPSGGENWFVMVNVEAQPEAIEKMIPMIRNSVIQKINRTLNIDLEPLIQNESFLTPSDIQARTSSHQGALYGASSNSPFAAFLRHRNRSTQLKGLYFCGGSVHPGGGIPLCLLSAKITAELIEKHA
ncbi:MAG: phytoene desaturase family protein [Bacteroidetes bacterium]|nr:phytoene desaturase family protein [Bacteroidota bacterium]MDA1335823.1 phytoene desaturase family protein [Bacteroidota bacterium]